MSATVKHGKYRITRQMVQSKKCIGCMMGAFALHELDKPKPGADGFICKDCYCSRLKPKEEMLVEQFATIGACIHTYENRNSYTYAHCEDRDYHEWCVERHAILSRCKKDILAILEMTDIEAVKKLHKVYNDERFRDLDEEVAP